MTTVVDKRKHGEYLVRFSEDLMEVIDGFKEEMKIICDEDLMDEINVSEKNSKARKTRILTPKQMKNELGL